MAWVTLAVARREWPDAPTDDARLQFLLTAAEERCSAFLGGVPPGSIIPVAWQLAVILDARDLWGAEAGVGGDLVGIGEAVVSLPAIARKVKGLLRPHRGIVVG